MTRRQVLYLFVPIVVVFVVTAFLLGCGGGAQGGEEEVASPSEDDIISYENGYRYDYNGWIYLHIEGEPYERGFQHGYLMAPELAEIMEMLEYTTFQDTGKEWGYFVEQAERIFMPNAEEEYIEEMKGIADGATQAGTEMTWQEVLAWNGDMELTGYWWPNEEAGAYDDQPDNEHCSAFIATGSYTADGGVVMAHNSWDMFVTGQYFNVILDIEPSEGNRMFMQSVPGYIDSMTDFFVTSAGIMGTETTLGGYSDYDPNEEAEFFRVRKAMQYADDLDGFVDLMQKKNNGGYANSWLLGDIGQRRDHALRAGVEVPERGEDQGRLLRRLQRPLRPRAAQPGVLGHRLLRYPDGHGGAARAPHPAHGGEQGRHRRRGGPGDTGRPLRRLPGRSRPSLLPHRGRPLRTRCF